MPAYFRGSRRFAVVLAALTTLSACSNDRQIATEPNGVSLLIDQEECNPCGVGPSTLPPPYQYETVLAWRVDSLIRAYPKAPPGTKKWDALIYAVDTARMLEYMSPFRDNVETYGDIATTNYQNPLVSLSVSGTAVSFKMYRGVETIYGGSHTIGVADPEYGAGGNPLSQGGPILTCANISLAFYDANRRVNSMMGAIGYVAGGVTLGTVTTTARSLWANGVQGNAASAVTVESLARTGMIASVALDTYMVDVLVAQWNRNILAGQMRLHNCM